MSERIRGDFGPKQLDEFIRKRFEFFLQAVGKQGLILLQSVKSLSDQDPQMQFYGTATIEVVCPIAPYRVVTLEKLMRKRNHHVTKSMHPMMSVDFDQNDGLVSISAPDPEKRIYD